MSDTSGISTITISLDPDPGMVLGLTTLVGEEELGQPFCYTLMLWSATQKGDLTAMLGSSATITFDTNSGKRHVNGVVTRATYMGLVDATHSYRLELRPWIWLLSRTQNCQIFQQMSVWSIITKIFRDAGFSDFEDKRQSQSGDQVLEYCVQYDETSLDFVSRLMEKFGLYYYFSHSAGKHTVVMADDPNSHTALAKALPYHVQGSQLDSQADYVSGWGADMELQPGGVAYRDYNFTTPAADLTATAKQPSAASNYARMEVYNYPGSYATTGDGQKLAAVRMQGFGAAVRIVRGKTNARALLLGGKFTLSGSDDTSQNAEYLVISARTSLQATQGISVDTGSVLDSYVCEFAAIPGATVFRTAPRTPWPVMRGPQTAKVVGASGDEITTDQYGRIKVSFFWDRLSKQDENSSCWIRVAQGWAGVSWGSIFIPRVGQEVIVDFLDGNPDRPIITGSVYNATTSVPYTLPDNKTRSTIKSNSSTGGGGFNELRFEDKAGSEEVFFQAQKDYNKIVLNNETVNITQDTTTTVKEGNRSVTVAKGNDSLTVSTGDHSTTISQGNRTVTVSQGNDGLTVSQGNRSVTVSLGNDSLTVSAGNHTISVDAGSSTIKAAQSITLQVGGNSIVVNTEGVTINGTKIGLTAQAMLQANGGGEMTLQAGMISIN